MATLPAAKVASPEDAAEHPLPPRVQEALGELVGQAKEGLLALSVGVGLGVVAELMEEEVTEACGPKGKWNPGRGAHRHGRDDGAVTLGGRRVEVRRPRMRTPEGEHEVALRTYEHFADRDPLTGLVAEQMLAGVSARRFERTREPVGSELEAQARSTAKSATSRAFAERTRGALEELMSRRLDDVRLAALMLDGVELAERTHVVALGITTEGVKVPLGLWEGSTENAAVATALLSDLVERGLDTSQGVLCVIDGAKALRKAIRDVLGSDTPVQRCIRHKERNVCDQLAERERPAIRRRLRAAWAEDDYQRAKRRLEAIAADLARTDPDAAKSLREGLEETLTLTHLGVTGALRRTLSSTNPCESMVRHEAPCERRARTKTLNRAGWKTGPGLMQRPGEAGGSRGAGSRADGGSSPDDVAAGRHCQTPECALARPKGRARAKRWWKPLDRSKRPETWRIWAGRSNGAAGKLGGPLRSGLIDPGPVAGERLRVLPGWLQGYSRLPTRSTVHGERGKHPGCDRPLVAAGQARCPLMLPGRDGAAVVVRARESRAHGEGRQQDRGTRSHSGGRA